jgi:hypothetical protein
MKHLGIMIIHGMGRQESCFADDFIRRIRRQLGDKNSNITIEPCWWADVLQPKQDEVWNFLTRDARMRLKWLRRYMISYFGDPPQYLSGYFRQSGHNSYLNIHERVRISLARIEANVPHCSEASLMILAHSLGCAISSNYIWDEQHGKGIGKTPFEQTRPLVSFISYGCNIPLFVPPVTQLTCIQVPWDADSEMSGRRGRWLNVFAPSDILGFPMRAIWDANRRTVIEDVALNAGMWPLSRTPWSHTLYEKDGKFIRIICDEIRSFL